MKVVTAKEMARIEKMAYGQGESEVAFMESAGTGVAELAQQMIANLHLKPKITLLCGSGNNAGDAYVAGRVLRKGGFHVHALALAPLEKSSPLCQLQAQRFVEEGGMIEYPSGNDISFTDAELLIDGIFGTGFHGEVEGLNLMAIEKANQSRLPILSIDIPSGIDGSTGKLGNVAIKAANTLFLGLPKSGCFTKEVWDFMGKVTVHNFGLKDSYVEEAEEDLHLIDQAIIRKNLPPVVRTRHKYEAGYVVGIGGSPGMPGAPILSSVAALRSGAGIVRLLHPKETSEEMGMAPLEIIREGFRSSEDILEATKRASAVFIGPGLGTASSTVRLLKQVLPQINKPCVIDAEALTLIAENDISLPAQCILTPHHGEMKRLLKVEKEISFSELFEMSRSYAFHAKVTLVLKGAPTFIFHPQSKPFVCANGDPGMATAGSGDVLTGIIAAFLAQTHDPLKAAVLGVYFHAKAGEHAAKALSSYSMIASDITASLPTVFREYA